MDEQTRRLTRLWMSAQPIVAAFVSSMVPDFAAQDDVLQEVITAVIESFDTYDPDRPFIGWVLGVARNQVGLYRRKSYRDRYHFDESAVDLIAASFERVSTKDVQKLDFLRDCLERLNERDRRLCDLRYEQDLKPAGIASALGMTANSVSKSLQRIRDQLRNCIDLKASQAGRAV